MNEAAIAYFGLAIPLVGLLYWAYTKYLSMMADGKVTIEEVVDAVTEAADRVEDFVEEVKEVQEKTE
jgi:hypothetical protein